MDAVVTAPVLPPATPPSTAAALSPRMGSFAPNRFGPAASNRFGPAASLGAPSSTLSLPARLTAATDGLRERVGAAQQRLYEMRGNPAVALLLPEVGAQDAQSLVVLRLLLYTAPLALVLDWPAWGLTQFLLAAGIIYAILLVAYARSYLGLGGVNPIDTSQATINKGYYNAVLGCAALLALSPIAHTIDPSFVTRVGLAAVLFALVVAALALARKAKIPAGISSSPEPVNL